MLGYCSNCNQHFHVEPAVAGKIACGVLGLGAGAQAGLPGALLCALLGTAIGHAIDKASIPPCPWCGVVLRLVAANL